MVSSAEENAQVAGGMECDDQGSQEGNVGEAEGGGARIEACKVLATVGGSLKKQQGAVGVVYRVTMATMEVGHHSE